MLIKISNMLKKLRSLFSRKRSIGNHFAFLMSISITTTVILLSGYHLYIIDRLIEVSQTQKDFNQRTIANLVFEKASESLKNNNFNKLETLSKDLVTNRIILYAHVIDKDSKKCIWSSIPELIGTVNSTYDPKHNRVIRSKLQEVKYNDFKQIIGAKGPYIIDVGFYTDNPLIYFVDALLENTRTLALTFIFLGFIAAYIMAQIVTKPIHKLVIAAEEIAKGNLKFKITESPYDEINKLVFAFNNMSKKLDALYSSLEEQVKDRTSEVVIKNSELKKAYKELQDAQVMLIHNEKMRSLGELVAGITHEINNPINYIYGNLVHLGNYSSDLIKIIDTYEQISSKLAEEDVKPIQELKQQLEYSFICQDLPELIRSCKDGTERCKNIILDLKNFSRMDELSIKDIDIHQEIEASLNILHNKYKNRITVHKEFSDIPHFDCYAGQLSQVFINILDNASYAIKDKGDVFIRTRLENNHIIIEIEDSGPGIKKEDLANIFDPFFTTKPVGEGTGLGLSITYKIIKTHKGTIDVQSEQGKGTKFIIMLPIDGLKPKVDETLSESQNV